MDLGSLDLTPEGGGWREAVGGGCGLRLVSRGLRAAAPASLGSDPPNREWTASPLSGAPPRGPAHAEPSGDLAWVRRPQVTAVWMRPRTPSENRGGCVPGGLRTPSACSLLGLDTLLGSPPSTVSLWVRLHLGGVFSVSGRRCLSSCQPCGKRRARRSGRGRSPWVSGRTGARGTTCGSPQGPEAAEPGGGSTRVPGLAGRGAGSEAGLGLMG